MQTKRSKFEFDEIVLDPAKYFQRPDDVLENEDLSLSQKNEILRQWRYDARLMMTAEAENMGGGETIDIAEIDRALEVADVPERSVRQHTAKVLAQIDSALQRSPMVSERQLAEIKDLRKQILKHCNDGNIDRAERCAELALNVIAAGAPVKE